jgi:hypothetical protein
MNIAFLQRTEKGFLWKNREYFLKYHEVFIFLIRYYINEQKN